MLTLLLLKVVLPMMRMLFAVLFLIFSNQAFAYSVGKAKVIECATNHAGSCKWIVSKEFINPKNVVTASISLYQQYNAIFAVKQVVSIKKWNPQGTVYEVQVIGDWKISAQERKTLLAKQPLLKFVKLYKKQKRNRWVFDSEPDEDLFASN